MDDTLNSGPMLSDNGNIGKSGMVSFNRKFSLDFQKRLLFMEQAMLAGDNNNGATSMDIDEDYDIRPGDEESFDFKILADEQQQKALIPLKDDLSDWLNKMLGIDISVDTFMDVLDNGVYVCQLAQVIQTKAEESGHLKQKSPRNKIKFRQNATRESWFARDNTANFVSWCREWGVKEECLFESDDLVLRKNERSFILCLLELARHGSKFGVEPPSIIKLEKEIEKEEEKENLKTMQVRGNGQKVVFERSTSTSTSSQPSSSSSTPVSTPTGTPSSRRRGSAVRPTKLHQAVQRLTNSCNCSGCTFELNRLSEGKYKIGNKIVFIRMLKGKHLMVRVGGGWDTLEHFLLKHDPCRILEFNKGSDKFVVIQGKYKVS